MVEETEAELLQDTFVPTFAESLTEAIRHDYLMFVLVTSHTQGKLKSVNFPFGVGKTTLTMWLSYVFSGIKTGDGIKYSWDEVFANMVYNPIAALKLVRPGTPRRPFGLWDDVQLTAPAERQVPPPILRFASYVTTTRKQIGVFFMTAPNMREIAAPLRRLITFELIVPERGKYEVQQIKCYKNFRNPLMDTTKLEYVEEGGFPKLPKVIEEKYDAWREVEKAKIYGRVERDMVNFIKLSEVDLDNLKTGQVLDLEGTVRRNGHSYYVHLPIELGEKLQNKKIQVKVTV
jgi:hypothetical protein